MRDSGEERGDSGVERDNSNIILHMDYQKLAYFLWFNKILRN